MNANPKIVLPPQKARINAILEATQDFDAPTPPKPPPPVFTPPFEQDQLNNPTGTTWENMIPDLANLEDMFVASADLTKVRLVTRLEILMARRQTSMHRRKWALPVSSGMWPVARFDGRSRFSAVRYPDSFDYSFVTTAPYPDWMADETQREKALAALIMQEAGL
jgi:hypothetical protein